MIQNGLQNLCRTRRPHPVHLQRKNVIQQVISRRNLRKHLAHFARRFRFVHRPVRARPLAGFLTRHHDLSHAAPAALPLLALSRAGSIRVSPAPALHTSPPFRFVASAQIVIFRYASSCPIPSAPSIASRARWATPVTSPSSVSTK